MIVTKKKYDKDITALKEIIKNKDLEIDRKTNENALAHTELINKDNKIQKLENKIKEANEIDKIKSANIKDLNKEINELIVSTSAEKAHLINENNKLKKENEKAIKEVEVCKNDIVSMGKIYNNINRKLWANTEAQRQLRNLSREILDSDRIDKNYIGRYIADLAMLIGGGEPYKFEELKEEVKR